MSPVKLVQHGPVIIAVCVVTLFVLEAAVPLRVRVRPRLSRWLVNLVMTGITFVLGTYVVKLAAVRLSFAAEQANFGLLHVLPLPGAARFVLGFLLMDLTFYYWHRANHEVPILWRFHNVHHVDPDVDTSTSFRFHFGEVLYSTFFRVAQVGLIGISPLTFFFYELVFTCETAFHHTNVRIPVALERALNLVIVTPRMHGIHHSAVKEEVNSNYSVIFRWWDLIHGSLHLNVPQSAVTIGVPAYLGRGDNSVPALLKLPFVKQREYWGGPVGTVPTRSVSGAYIYTSAMME
jgi:sterol desaturase/sphingolipid hydroxylase (fatty acid hydroxylase superfamily)